MIDYLIKNTLDNTTFTSPSGNVDKLELNEIGKESINDLKELLLKLSEHSRWEEEHKVRIITSEVFMKYHKGEFIPEKGYNYYSADGDLLFYSF